MDDVVVDVDVWGWRVAYGARAVEAGGVGVGVEVGVAGAVGAVAVGGGAASVVVGVAAVVGHFGGLTESSVRAMRMEE